MLSIDLIRQELEKRGWENFQSTDSDNRRLEHFVRSGYEWVTRRGIVHYPQTDDRQFKLIKNKDLTNRLAKSLGINVPHTVLQRQGDKFSEVTALLRKYEYLVVKPSDSQGSWGLTLGIHNEQQLSSAMKNAYKVSSSIFVQEQCSGSEFRFTFIGTTLVSVIEKRKLSLIGDGEQTLRQLIDHENEERRELNNGSMLTYPAVSLPNMMLNMASKVLGLGQQLTINTSSLVGKGASLYEVKDDIDESYTRLAVSMAESLRTGVLCVDMLIQNITHPANDTNYCFLECNAGPALTMYYSTRNRQNIPILAHIGDWLDKLSD